LEGTNFVKKIILCIFLVSACSKKMTEPSQNIITNSTANVVYGEDGRIDFFETNDSDLQNMARSTVALIDPRHLIYDSVFDVYNLENAESSIPFCSTEKFQKQPKYADCSGSLVAPDIILTAGHCIQSTKDCANTKIVFDYTLKFQSEKLYSLPAKNVFSCQKIIAFSNLKNSSDFALIQLDRPALGRSPLELSTEQLKYKDPLMLIGHPMGLPTKFTLNGVVRSLIPEHYFTASLDAFSGNSGSAVFDQNTKKIVGVLVRGESDFDKKNGCYLAKHCDENGCRGEDVTRISEVLKYWGQ
jgi:V8-like Glu-specific endopeptidase